MLIVPPEVYEALELKRRQRMNLWQRIWNSVPVWHVRKWLRRVIGRPVVLSGEAVLYHDDEKVGKLDNLNFDISGEGLEVEDLPEGVEAREINLNGFVSPTREETQIGFKPEREDDSDE